MERIHKLTEEFMLTAGQIVREKPSIPTVDEMKLRLTLEFEELKEKAQAMGLEGTFAIIAQTFVDSVNKAVKNNNPSLEEINTKEKFISTLKLADTNIVNLVEVFDAALDQRVVASGTDLAFGFQHIIHAGDTEVHRSNMSKFDDNAFDSSETTIKYEKEGIETETHMVGDFMVCKRSSDKKILKSHKYSPADLKEIVQIGEFEGK